MDRLNTIQRSAYVHRLASHRPRYAVDGEEEQDTLPTEWEFLRVLLVGAGGLGCELLHLMAMSGFSNITIIDMDTIELSNLNRQFLFREKDIGRAKSEVAAEFVSQRCPGVSVTPIFGRVEAQDDDFYRSFDLIIVGVDSIQARRWMNAKVAEIAEWAVVPRDVQDEAGPAAADEDSEPLYEYAIQQAIPFLDTGTEGFEGHCRAFNLSAGPQRTPCQECIMWTFNENAKQVPMCTLESTPRAPEHCVLYAKVKLWEDAHRQDGLELDPDNVDHVRWITHQARERQRQFGIGGAAIDEAFALGVIKNVVPAVGFTNALVSGQAVTEAVKLAMGVAAALNNCTGYNGAALNGGVFLNLNCLDRDPQCPVCGPRPVASLRPDMTVAQLVAAACATAQRHDATRTLAPALFDDATVSLVFPPAVAATGGSQPPRPARPQREVFLAFKSNNPMRVPITGDRVEAIVRAAPDGEALIADWRAGLLFPTLRISADKNTVTELIRYHA